MRRTLQARTVIHRGTGLLSYRALEGTTFMAAITSKYDFRIMIHEMVWRICTIELCLYYWWQLYKRQGTIFAWGDWHNAYSPTTMMQIGCSNSFRLILILPIMWILRLFLTWACKYAVSEFRLQLHNKVNDIVWLLS